MGNNRLNIVNKRQKRKRLYNILTIVIIISIFILSILLIQKYLNKDNKIIIESTTTSTTTDTTKVTAVTVPQTTTEGINNIYSKDFVYNFSIENDKYKVIVCNVEAYARVTSYNLYYKNNIISESSSNGGVLVDKNSVDLSKTPKLSIVLRGKNYTVKYDNKCS